MRVFVAGATGVIGQPVIQPLAADDEPMRRRELANAIAEIEGVAPPALPDAMSGEVPDLIDARRQM